MLRRHMSRTAVGQRDASDCPGRKPATIAAPAAMGTLVPVSIAAVEEPAIESAVSQTPWTAGADTWSPEATLASSELRARSNKNFERHGTALTNLFGGRPARGIVNRLIREVGPMSPLAPAFPLAGNAIAPLRKQSETAGSPDSRKCGQAKPEAFAANFRPANSHANSQPRH